MRGSLEQLLCAMLMFFGPINFAQNTSTLLEEWQPQSYEKIYLHTDRDFYLAGEILWFKAYLTNPSGKLSNLSKIAYIEIIDSNNDIIQQQYIKLDNGLGNSSFYLPVNLKSGNFTIRAYTRFMKNFGEQNFFNKHITIINTLKNEGITKAPKENQPLVHISPEGGSLVSGLRSTVGVKVNTPTGLGLKFKAALINGAADTLSTFTSLVNGMGRFELTPSLNERYSLVIYIDSTTIIKKLPQILENGLTMEVKKDEEIVNLTLLKSKDYSAPWVYLLIHNRNQITRNEVINFDNNSAQFGIPEKDLPVGINIFTILNKDKEPIAERLYFKAYNLKELIKIDLKQTELATRTTSSISINTVEEGNLSMAVYYIDSLQTNKSANIVSFQLLKDYIKGYIETPEIYFQQNSQSDLFRDNLMLTQGWRSFIQPKQSLYEPEYEGHILTGKISGIPPQEIANGLGLFLSIPGDYSQFFHGEINPNSTFKLLLHDVYGRNSVFVTTTTNDSTYKLEFDTPYSDKLPSFKPLPLYLSPQQSIHLEKRSTAMQIQNIYSGNSQNDFIKPALDKTPFYGIADKTYLLDDYTRFPTIMEVMTEYVPEVSLKKDDKKYRFRVFAVNSNNYLEDEPLMLVNGIPFKNADNILKLDPLKIKQMDIVAQRFVMGKQLFPGIINYVGYNNKTDWITSESTNWETEIEGLEIKRLYYTPGPEELKNMRKPDYRTLISWIPEIHSNSKPLTVSFTTSDITGNYIGVIEGILNDGTPVHTTFKFNVKDSQK